MKHMKVSLTEKNQVKKKDLKKDLASLKIPTPPPPPITFLMVHP